MNDESGRESLGMLGCADGRDEDRDQFLCLCAQVGELACADDCGFLEQVKPVKGFVKFLYGDLQLTDKLSSRTSPARLAIMRADRCAAAQHLLAKHLGNCRLRQRCVQTNNPQRKSLRSLLQVRLFASHNFLRLSVPSQFIIHHSSFIVHRSPASCHSVASRLSPTPRLYEPQGRRSARWPAWPGPGRRRRHRRTRRRDAP